MNPICRLKLIGQMEAWSAKGDSVLPIGRKTRAMLAMLAMTAPRAVLRAKLADVLWSRRHEEQARASLRQELHRLLEALQPIGQSILEVTRDHIVLRPGMVWVDAQEVLCATPANPGALKLLEGELLEEFDDIDPALDIWLAGERSRLRDRARSVAEVVLAQQEELELAIPAAQQLLSIDRSHEGAWRALMQGYAARGERGKAIQAYEQCRGVLTDLLNAAPLPDTQRLAAEIRAGQAFSPRAPAAAPAQATPKLRSPVKIGALPLQPISIGADERQFSLGLAEELTVALSRFGWMRVVSSSSLVQAGDRSEAMLRSAFGLDLLLDGSVQHVLGRLRITMRLLDLRDGSKVVWTYRADHPVKDLLSLQDDVAAEIASQVDAEVLRLEGRLAAMAPAGTQTASDLVLSSLLLLSRLRREEFREMGAQLDRALQLDPDCPAAHAWTAWRYTLQVAQGWGERSSEIVETARSHADRAISLDPQYARGLTIAGHVRSFLQGLPDQGAELHARALLLNPNLGMAWGLSATTSLYLGELDQAAEHFERYKRLSPVDPNAFFFDASMSALELLRGSGEAAVSLGRLATELNPRYAGGLKHYLAALGHLRQTREAGVVLSRLLAIDPRCSVQSALSSAPFVRPEHRNRYAEGLRTAGVPETTSEAAFSDR